MILVFGDSHVGYLEPHLDARVFVCNSYAGWPSERMVREADWTLDVALAEDNYDACVLVGGSNDASDEEAAESLRALRNRVLAKGVATCWIVSATPAEAPWIRFPDLVGAHMTDVQARRFAELLAKRVAK